MTSVPGGRPLALGIGETMPMSSMNCKHIVLSIRGARRLLGCADEAVSADPAAVPLVAAGSRK